MTTTTRLSGLGRWLGRSLGVAVAIAFCASAFAEPSKNVVELAKPSKKKVFYTYATNSRTPQPYDRLGVIPTTSTPMTTYGVHLPEKEAK